MKKETIDYKKKYNDMKIIAIVLIFLFLYFTFWGVVSEFGKEYYKDRTEKLETTLVACTDAYNSCATTLNICVEEHEPTIEKRLPIFDINNVIK